MNFMNVLEPKARSRMGGESIIFPPYTKEKLEDILDGSNTTAEKAYKVGLLYKNVLENQNIRNMDVVAFRAILDAIENNILPFINDKSTAGQDLLNLFFITFNTITKL